MLLQNCISNKKSHIIIRCNTQLADDILNKKKKYILELEKEYACKLHFEFNDYVLLNQPSIQVSLEKNNNKKDISNPEDKKLIKLKNKKNNKKTVQLKKRSSIKAKER